MTRSIPRGLAEQPPGKTFAGFSEAETFTSIPDSFVRELAGKIHDLVELKVTLFALWHLSNQTGADRWLQATDLSEEQLGLSLEDIAAGLDRAVGRGSLLALDGAAQRRFVMNSPAGREIAGRLAEGARQLGMDRGAPPLERPNAFRLYEENIGPLTPVIADALKDSESSFSTEWLQDAIREAARQNKRSLSYIQAILKRWKEEGRANKQDRRSPQEYDWENLDRRITDLRRRSEK